MRKHQSVYSFIDSSSVVVFKFQVKTVLSAHSLSPFSACSPSVFGAESKGFRSDQTFGILPCV